MNTYEATVCAADTFHSAKKNKDYTKLYVILNRGIAEVIVEGDATSMAGTPQQFVLRGQNDGGVRLALAMEE